MQKHIQIMLFFTCLLVAQINYAWNDIGHRIVAHIAYSQLQPDVRDQINRLVSNFNQEYPNIYTFEDLTAWPDTLRAQKVELYTRWHYINIAFSADTTPMKDLVDTDNAIWAINTIEPIVQNTNANTYERARSLAFLAHIVGDLHQPLHCISRISAAHPDGDQGGNLFYIYYPLDHPKKMNLHQLWDKGFDLLAGDSSSEHIAKLSEMIETLYPQQYFGDAVFLLKPDQWSQEGFTLAQQIAYNTPEDKTPSETYVNTGTELSEQELALAGYRLANILNSLLNRDTQISRDF